MIRIGASLSVGSFYAGKIMFWAVPSARVSCLDATPLCTSDKKRFNQLRNPRIGWLDFTSRFTRQISSLRMEKDQFCELQKKLVEQEQQTEVDQVNEEYKKYAEKELVKRGIILKVPLLGIKSGIAGTTLLQFENKPESSFRVGDVVEIALKEEMLSAVVVKSTDTQLVVSIKQDLPNDLPSNYKIKKMVNSITYQRMQDAMESLKTIDSHLFRVLLLESKPTIGPPSTLQFFDDSLNASQKDAIAFCVQTNELGLIHGPPGTGKTHACVELIRQLVHRKQRVLVCGPSNISVDNIVERLGKLKLDIVRVGHPARVLDSVVHHCLDMRIDTSDQGQIVKDVRKELDDVLSQIQKTKRKQDRHKLYQDVKFLRSELKQREKEVLKSVITNAQVVLTTLNGSASKILKNEIFDVVLVDEASQALEAECWIAILKGKKLILAGDHCQLPPTVKSSNKAGQQLMFTLFERMLKHYPQLKRLLNVQYRMNKVIMQFSSDYFYESKLTCHEGVEDRLLTDLENITENEETTCPVVFIDTAHASFFDSTDEQDSKYNTGEAESVVKYLEGLFRSGVIAEQVAVISPYNGQIRILKELLGDKYPGLELGSVDGFQGREKEVVLLSLVRSNADGEVGFLSEDRRLNVAMTRPKRHLCIIGDSSTLSRHPFLKKVVTYLEDHAEIRYPEMIE
jgi:superfamily I DNA and/or RNA helicase